MSIKTTIERIEEFEETDMTVDIFNDIFKGSTIKKKGSLTVEIGEIEIGGLRRLYISDGTTQKNSLTIYPETYSRNETYIEVSDGKIYKSLPECAKHYQINPETIRYHIKNGSSTRKGLSFKQRLVQ